MQIEANWITPSFDAGDCCPLFQRTWSQVKQATKAELIITALGVYDARLNGKAVSDYVLAPGWTSYENRLQYQCHDVLDLLEQHNELIVSVGKGWFSSPMPGWIQDDAKEKRQNQPCGLLAQLNLTYEDGTSDMLCTDDSWFCSESGTRFSEIYDGETFDATFTAYRWSAAKYLEWSKEILIPQEGEEIKEVEWVLAKSVIKTPAGDTVIDFGQVITGYVSFTVNAHAGDKIKILHGEVLDKDGNFYNANYRSAKSEINYTCKEGVQSWHPLHTFFGFRYLKLEQFPCEVAAEQFEAIVVCSDLRQTGRIETSNEKLNQLFYNILWGQKGNFLDVPTDCPQRDERLGWTGDAQAFVKAASYNYDVEKFFAKWLRDLAADQRPDGGVGSVIPDVLPTDMPGAAWGDAAVICPWQIYLTYGNAKILRNQFQSMKKWVDFITGATKDPFLWTGGVQFGDWLGLDAPVGSYKGSTREEFIASAFYAYSTSLLIKAGIVLGADVSAYEALHTNIVKAFRKTFTDYRTQTEHILAVQFNLAENPREIADALAEMVRRDGIQLRTGFVGTPYILHVLSDYGHAELAYSLLLREEYPSWLYPVSKGATTVWEHWDGIMENGDFWHEDMNSFNHYAYGAVADWIYEKAAGICTVENAPGFAKVVVAPNPDKRLGWLKAELDTRHGKISSKWTHTDGGIRYEITTPVPARIVIKDKEYLMQAGTYTLWSEE